MVGVRPQTPLKQWRLSRCQRAAKLKATFCKNGYTDRAAKLKPLSSSGDCPTVPLSACREAEREPVPLSACREARKRKSID